MIENKEKTAYKFKMASIFNLNTGKEEPADFHLSQEIEKIYKLRYALKKNKKSYCCPVCKTPVILKQSSLGNFFFAHTKLPDDKTCFLVQESNSQESTIQEYNHRKESDEHKRLKHFVADNLRTTVGVNSSSVKIERNLKDEAISTEWKRPDVQCLVNNKRFAFEIQLCQTWLHDIVMREVFYEKIRTSILWIFKDFDPSEIGNHVTKNDIFYNNPELNVFVLDEEAENLSRQKRQLHLKCYYKKAAIKNNSIQLKWVSEIIKVTSVKIDTVTYKPFYRKIQEQVDTLQKQLDELREQEKKQILSDLYSFTKTEDLQIKRVENVDFSDIKNVVNAVFGNKISRSENNLNAALFDLQSKGIDVPTLEYLQSKGLIKELNINSYNKHFEMAL
jgi:competence CoiA-like predicted nuclease